ncbi:transposase, partial [Streptomyces sp. NPDC058321]
MVPPRSAAGPCRCSPRLRGRSFRRDDRVVLNGIVWKLRTGSAWRDVPERYGSW